MGSYRDTWIFLFLKWGFWTFKRPAGGKWIRRQNQTHWLCWTMNKSLPRVMMLASLWWLGITTNGRDVSADCQNALMTLSPNANNLSIKVFLQKYFNKFFNYGWKTEAQWKLNEVKGLDEQFHILLKEQSAMNISAVWLEN